MKDSNDREYVIEIDPRILELLGPSLYANIYYVLAELIANAYDADAKNVYIIQKKDRIIVEDDGLGMSYENGDIEKYLKVAVETRTTKNDAFTEGGRRRIGRKGVGKLAALSVSENVLVMTMHAGEKSGFVLSRRVDDDHKLTPIKESEIIFHKVKKNGTSIVMTDPQYGLHKTANAIKKNLLKMFPGISKDFRIHVTVDGKTLIIDSFDKEMIKELGALIVLGKKFHDLSGYFDCGLANAEEALKELLVLQDVKTWSLKLKNRAGKKKKYELCIEGWVGAYRSTRGRKNDPNDFRDNFISLLSNGKLGEYDILQVVGKNALNEVYVVGQLHVDLFEETELPDIALSNRQGYKTDDERYRTVLKYVREVLLPQIVELRVIFATYKNKEKAKEKEERQKAREKELREKVNEFKRIAANSAAKRIAEELDKKSLESVEKIIEGEMNKVLPIIGLKTKIDSQKKRILISHTKQDKPLADVVFKMLLFNGVPDAEIIYTNSDNEVSRIPEDMGVFEYLREFFVNSYSDEKIFVIFVTSKDMAKSWGAVTEVGAGWITRSDHRVFNIEGHTPQKPLNIDIEWQTSKKDGDNIVMDSVEFDKFVVRAISICKSLGYSAKNKKRNETELKRYVSIK